MILALAATAAHVAAQEELATGTISIRYWSDQARLARALAENLEGPLRLPGLPDDVLGPDTVVIYLAPDASAFDTLAPGVPDWSAGIAFPEGGRIVLPAFGARMGQEPLASILRHELAHVALSRYLGRAVPRWFHEGYAQLATGSWNATNAWKLRVAMLLGQIPNLESLSLDFPRDRLSAEDAYLLSYTAVEYLWRLGGSAGFARLLQRWRELGDLDAALRHTYGMTLTQFQELWRKEVRRRFGWLLVLAQASVFWLGLTILLLVLGYWKIRRDRRKLARLRALEAQDEIVERDVARPVEEDHRDGPLG